MDNPALFVVIGCDTDPIYPDGKKVGEQVAWDETVHSVFITKKIIRNSATVKPKITWFLRSDWEMEKIFGDWSWPAKHYRSIWEYFEYEGDELGWHPHLARLDQNGGWYQETSDANWIENCLKNGYKSLSQFFKTTSTRMGWDFHNNVSMNTLDELGIKIDLSALPGMGNSGNQGENIFDWSSTPEIFYHPSRTNYQCPGNNNLNIIELPINCSNISFGLNNFKVVKRNYWQRRCAALITKHPYFFKANILKALSNASRKGYGFLNCYFHPHDISSRGPMFSKKNFQSNLLLIEHLAKKHRNALHYITASEAQKIIENIEKDTGNDNQSLLDADKVLSF